MNTYRIIVPLEINLSFLDCKGEDTSLIEKFNFLDLINNHHSAKQSIEFRISQAVLTTLKNSAVIEYFKDSTINCGSLNVIFEQNQITLEINFESIDQNWDKLEDTRFIKYLSSSLTNTIGDDPYFQGYVNVSHLNKSNDPSKLYLVAHLKTGALLANVKINSPTKKTISSSLMSKKLQFKPRSI